MGGHRVAFIVGCVSILAAQTGPPARASLARGARSSGCRVPDVRGFEFAYARDLLSKAGCHVGSVHRLGRAGRGLVVVAQSPAPGARLSKGRRERLTLGRVAPGAGCPLPRFQLRARSAGAYVWESVTGNPLSGGDRPYSVRLLACVPPAGRPLVVWEEPVVPSSSSYGQVQTAGHAVGLVVSEGDQYTSRTVFDVLDLSRPEPLDNCEYLHGPQLSQPPRYCPTEINEVVVASGGVMALPSETFEGLVDQYVLDPQGDVAWLGNLAGVKGLYLAAAPAKVREHTNKLVEKNPGAVTGLRLANGLLSWIAGGEAHSVAVGSA